MSARFFGFAADSATPNSAARLGEAPLTVAIQDGGSGSSPSRGRRPLLRGHHEEEESDGDLQPVEPRIVLIGVASRPDEKEHDDADQDEARDPAACERRPAVRALGDPRISTTPTIGIGLSATASAAGSRSPIASFNTPGILSAPVDGAALPSRLPSTNGRCRARTYDLEIKSLLLYQLS